MVVIALDLARTTCGYCVLHGERVVNHFTTMVTNQAGGLSYLCDDILRQLQIFTPDTVVAEVPGRWLRASQSTSTQTMEGLIEAWAACQIAWGMYPRICYLVRMDPAEAKEAIAGDRRASKEAVRRSLELQGYELKNWDNHQIDALAIGLAWIRSAGRIKESNNS